MKANFSFSYGGVDFNANSNHTSTDNGLVYAVDNDVTVTLKQTYYENFNALEWVLYFENKSDKNSKVFSDILDSNTLLDLTMTEKRRPGFMPKEEDVNVISMNGMVGGWYYHEDDRVSSTEYNFHREYLDKLTNVRKYQNTNGRSSEGTMPFFDVNALNCGYITAVGWSGDWKAEFTKVDDGVVFKSGLKFTNFYLKPNEKIRTTSVLIMKYNSEEDKHNKFRALLREHFSYKIYSKTEREGLMATELWGGLPSQEMIKRLREYNEYGIKFEDVWIDAGWYGDCSKCDEAFSGDWHSKTGDWYVNPRPHPNGLDDVKEIANSQNMKLMLWLEPERAVLGTSVITKHPDWFIIRPNQTSNLLNLGNEDAKNYVKHLLVDYAKKLNLSCYRQDFNFLPTNWFEYGDEENRRGITEIKHILGMYEVWEYLLENVPGIIIDNCASGGRRIDIESLKRSIPFFRSDYQCAFNENPEVLQTHNANSSAYFPYIGCTSKTKNDTYAIRSSYSSSWGGAFYNTIFQTMDKEDFLWAKKITDEYLEVRQYFSLDFYNHGANVFDDTSWAIFEYSNPKTNSGIILAFRRSNSPFDNVTIDLKGVMKDKIYTAYDYDSKNTVEFKNSLKITLPNKRSSALIHYNLK